MKFLEKIKAFGNKFFLDSTIDANKVPNVILCTCIGDALGMPFEGLSRENKAIKEWDGKSFLPSRPRPPAYYGSSLNNDAGGYTDDGQMSIMVAESLIENKNFNPKDLSERYVDWIYSGKARGFGKTTKFAIDNLKNGTHWAASGIEGSYGNGTAMRAAPFGAFYARARNVGRFTELVHAVKIDSAITHRSIEAEAGALTIAITTFLSVLSLSDRQFNKTKVCEYLAVHLPDSDVKRKTLQAYDMAMYDSRLHLPPMKSLVALGTRADVRQSVPAAMYCYWRFDSFKDAVVAAIRAGGDADTTAAIVGGMFGANTKLGTIPYNWIKKVENSVYLRDLDTKLSPAPVKVTVTPHSEIW